MNTIDNGYDIKDVTSNENSNLDCEMLVGHNRLTIIDKTKNSSQPIINMETKIFILQWGVL